MANKKVLVDLDYYQQCWEYMRRIDHSKLTDLVFMRGDKRYRPSKKAMAEWEFVGLCSSDFILAQTKWGMSWKIKNDPLDERAGK